MNPNRYRLFYYFTLFFGPLALFGQARGMAIYLPLLATVAGVMFIRDINVKSMVRFENLDKYSIYSFIFMGLYALASLSWSVSPTVSFNAVCRLLPLMISILILIGILQNSSINLAKTFFQGLCHSYIFLIIIVTIDLITHGQLSNWQNTIIGKSEKWHYTNSSASLIVVCCFVWPVISYLHTQYNHKRASILFLLALLLTFMIQHMSARISILMASLAFLMVYQWPRLTLKALAIIVTGYLFVAPFIHAMSFDVMVELWREHLYKISHSSALHRIFIWSYVSELIAQKPLYGWGLGAAKFLGGVRHHLPPHYFELLPNHPHNGALHLWLELGFIGVTVFSMLVLRLINMLYNMTNRFHQAAASAAFVGVLTTFSVSFGVWQSWWFATMGLLVISFYYLKTIVPVKPL